MDDLPEYTLRISPRARRVRLTVSLDKGLVVVAPKGFDPALVAHLLRSKREWIDRSTCHMERRKQSLPPHLLTSFPERLDLNAVGQSWKVRYRRTGSGRVAARETGPRTLMLCGHVTSSEDCGRALGRWIVRQGRAHLLPWLQGLAGDAGYVYSRAGVRLQRTRWASCSGKGTISLNGALLFLKPALVRYVLLHELCHTRHLNHSADFWNLLKQHEPGCLDLDKDLRRAWRSVPLVLGAG